MSTHLHADPRLLLRHRLRRRHPDRARGGARVVPLAVRAAARARLPLDGDRGHAGRPQEGVGARRVLVPSLLFIASFSAIFILLGLSATVIGSTLNEHKHALEQIGGVVIMLMGVIFLATPFVRDAQPRVALRAAAAPRRPRRAASWPGRRSRSPGRRARASRSARSSRRPRSRARRRTARCCSRSTPLGLAIPFLLIALAFERMTDALSVVKRHFPVIIAIGGAVMIAARRADPHGRVHDAERQANTLLHGTGLDVSSI